MTSRTFADSVKVLHVPNRIRVDPALTAARLETHPLARRIEISERAEVQTIADAVIRSGPVPAAVRGDIRYGVYFYAASGEELGCVFVDRFGSCGQLEDDTVRFTDDVLVRELERLCEVM